MMTAVMPQYSNTTTANAPALITNTRRRSRFTVVSVDDDSPVDTGIQPVAPKPIPASPRQISVINPSPSQTRKPEPINIIKGFNQSSDSTSGSCEIRSSISALTLYCDCSPSLIESPSVTQPLTELKIKYAVVQQSLEPNILDLEPPVTVEYSKNYRRASLPGALRPKLNTKKYYDTNRKRVSFADDVVTCVLEPIKDEHVERTPRREQELQLLQHDDTWICQFDQPVLSTNNITGPAIQLLSSTVRNNELCGMIRVRNSCFEKRVLVHCAFDRGWDIHKDREAQYVYSDHTETFDLFSFRVCIPEKVSSVQFCCLLVANGEERWDNHDGSNYEIKRCDTDVMQHT